MWRKTEESLEKYLWHEVHWPLNKGNGVADMGRWWVLSRALDTWDPTSLPPPMLSPLPLSLSPSVFIEQIRCLEAQVPVRI